MSQKIKSSYVQGEEGFDICRRNLKESLQWSPKIDILIGQYS